jgi:hypothetical protein
MATVDLGLSMGPAGVPRRGVSRGWSPAARLVTSGLAAVLMCAPLLVAPAQAAVSTRLSTGWSDTSVRVGQTVSVRGVVGPARISRTVVLQRRSSSGWAAVDRSRTRDGAYRFRFAARRPGEFRFRVRALQTPATAPATSRTRQVRVTRLARRGNPHAFSFIGTSGDAVARWNPCRRIGYRVNARLGGRGALADTKEAIARIRQASGLRFTYQGTTSIVPGGSKRRYPGDTDLVIAWARPSQSEYLRGTGVAGMGGPSWTSAVNERGQHDLMIVRGFAVLNANLRLGHGFGGGARNGYYGTRGQLLMHEIGHAVGMGHADNDEWQILYPRMTGKRAVWGAGDLRGLNRLGTGRGCLSTRSLRTTAGGPPTQTGVLS